MPRMDSEELQTGGDPRALAKLMIIGEGKMGKSHFAGMAAAAGFNVLFLDGDVARATIKKLPVEARKRIFLMSIGDTMLDGQRDSKMWDIIREFTTSSIFRWNDSKQKMALRGEEKTDEIWEIKPGMMGCDTILVLDSWTSLAESIILAAANAEGVDLATAKTTEMRPVYMMSASKATQVLMCLRSIRCHVIVLGHPDEFTHTTAPDKAKVGAVKETDRKIDWTKMIPKSTSKPHGMQIAKYLTDMGWMEVGADGTRYLNFKLDPSRVSGGNWDDRKASDSDYAFINLVKLIGGVIPDPKAPVNHDSWLKIIPPGEATAAPATTVLDGTAPATPIAAKGFAGLMKKPA